MPQSTKQDWRALLRRVLNSSKKRRKIKTSIKQVEIWAASAAHVAINKAAAADDYSHQDPVTQLKKRKKN
jgi:hypothetical protein